MAQIEFDLIDGLRMSDDLLKKVIMRDANAGDIIEAQEESERPVMTDNGLELLASPVMLALNTMRRQIVSIGNVNGPISVAELKKLSSADLNLLQYKCEELDEALSRKLASVAVAKRGRTEPDDSGNLQDSNAS